MRASPLSATVDLELVTDEDVQVLTEVVNGVGVGATELLSVIRIFDITWIG